MKGQLLVHTATCFLPFSLYVICVAEYLFPSEMQGFGSLSTPLSQQAEPFLGVLGFSRDCKHLSMGLPLWLGKENQLQKPFPQSPQHILVLSNDQSRSEKGKYFFSARDA